MINNLILLLLAIALVFMNAFFVAAEFGMVKLRETRVTSLKRRHGLRGKILAQIHKHLDAYLSACQLGITLASLGLGWIGEPALAKLLAPFFQTIGIDSHELIAFLAFLIAFSILSFLHIVVGELMPKSLAIRQSEKVSLWTAIPLYGFYWIMYPAIWLLNSCANALLRLTRLNASDKNDTFYTPEEIKLVVNASHLHGQLSKQETDILKHAVDFTDLRAVDVMRPIEDMMTVSLDQPIAEALSIMHQYRYSRYPVYSDAKNAIVGVVHMKDLFAALYEKKKIVSLKPLMRPILKISPRTPAMKLLNQFRRGLPHFAIVYHHGQQQPLGFVTLDHLFLVLVGRIRDEFHKTQEDWVIAADGGYVMNGKTSLYTVERALDIDIEIDEASEENIDTIAGLILTHLGRMPQLGEKIEFDQFMVTVTNIQGHRIRQVTVYPRTSKH